jgi:hypothetical protein
MVGVRQSVDPTPILYRLLRRTEWRRRDGTTAHPGRDNTLRASPGHTALPESGNRTGELKRARKLLVDIGWDAAQARVSVPITPVRKVVESSLQKRCDTAPLVAGGECYRSATGGSSPRSQSRALQRQLCRIFVVRVIAEGEGHPVHRIS